MADAPSTEAAMNASAKAKASPFPFSIPTPKPLRARDYLNFASLSHLLPEPPGHP
jgi:hypothetical protein